MNDKHVPVLLQEVIQYLKPQPGKNYIDATLGFGGHSEEILNQTAPDGKLLGIDQDSTALHYAIERLESFGDRFVAVKGNFAEIDELASGFLVTGGILADIGVSSVQFDEAERGFSFQNDGPLNMRMNQDSGVTAAEIINRSSEAELAKILKEYGEEKFAKRIARKIVEARQKKHIENTKEFAEIVSAAIPRAFWPKGINPSTKTFQALRIAVNDELGVLTNFLPKAIDMLAPGARLAVISFHSLEDRIVKDYFLKRTNPCTCPPEFPKCVCGKVGDTKIITKHPITATDEEISQNPRSRSAKLRVIEKL